MHVSTMEALLMEKALEMIIGYDEKGVILYANPEARSRLGYGEELLGMNLRSVVKPAAQQNKISFAMNINGKHANFQHSSGREFDARIRLLEIPEEETLSFLLALPCAV